MNNRSRRGRPSRPAILSTFVVLMVAACVGAHAGETERVSVGTSGAQGDDDSRSPNISGDGLSVAFQSAAGNWMPDTGPGNVYVRDRVRRRTDLITLNANGEPEGSDAPYPALSADGRFAAFQHHRSFLNPDRTAPPTVRRVYSRDRIEATSRLMSVNSRGASSNGFDGPHSGVDFVRSYLSGDGQTVAFSSDASNLTPVHGVLDVYVHDGDTGVTEDVSLTSSGAAVSCRPLFLEELPLPIVSLSPNGRFAAFTHRCNLMPDDTNSSVDVHVFDRASGQLERVSVTTGGEEVDRNTFTPSIDDSGRFVVFHSAAANLVPGNPGAVFVRDRALHTTSLVSAALDGSPARGSLPVISANGRYVAFASDETSLVEQPTHGNRHIFVRDLMRGTTKLASVSSAGVPGGGWHDVPSISANGRFVAFESTAPLVSGDTNGAFDVFVHDMYDGTVPADRFEANDDTAHITRIAKPAWSLEHALCVPWPFPVPPYPDPASRCPGIFENGGGRPWSSADRWTFAINDLSLHSVADRDFFRVPLPDPAAFPETADIRPEEIRRRSPTPRVPIPECDVVSRTDLGGRLVTVVTSARLDITAVPTHNTVADFELTSTGEAIRIYRGTIFDKPLSRGPALRKTIYCPKTFESMNEVAFSFGDGAAARMSGQLGGYSMHLAYSIESHRNVPDWVRPAVEQAGMRTIVDVPCEGNAGTLPGGRLFPGCPGGAGDRMRIDMLHPMTPRFPDCIADGPGCFEPFLVQWPAVTQAFDVTFTADPRFTFQLQDDQQRIVAQATPLPNDPAPAGQMTYRMLAPGLPAGLYVLTVRGPPGPYALHFRALPSPFQNP